MGPPKREALAGGPSGQHPVVAYDHIQHQAPAPMPEPPALVSDHQQPPPPHNMGDQVNYINNYHQQQQQAPPPPHNNNMGDQVSYNNNYQQQQQPKAPPPTPTPHNNNMAMGDQVNYNNNYQQQQQQAPPGQVNYSYQQQSPQAPQVVQFPPPSPINNVPAAFPPVNNNNNNGGAHAFPPQNGTYAQQQQQQYGNGNGNGYNNGMPPASPMKQVYQSPVNGVPMAAPGTPVSAWKSGLFDCMDDPMNAIITTFFPCLTFGQIAEIVDGGHTSCGTSGMLYGLVGFFLGVPFIMSCTYRTKMRNMFGLAESPAPDWVTHFLCEWCALCQEYRELQHRGFDPSIGWLGNQALRQHQQVMMAPPMNQRMMG